MGEFNADIVIGYHLDYELYEEKFYGEVYEELEEEEECPNEYLHTIAEKWLQYPSDCSGWWDEKNTYIGISVGEAMTRETLIEKVKEVKENEEIILLWNKLGQKENPEVKIYPCLYQS